MRCHTTGTLEAQATELVLSQAAALSPLSGTTHRCIPSTDPESLSGDSLKKQGLEGVITFVWYVVHLCAKMSFLKVI